MTYEFFQKNRQKNTAFLRYYGELLFILIIKSGLGLPTFKKR